MNPKRQSFIQHVLVLLVVLVMPHMASADDPYQPYTIESSPQSGAGLDGEWITEIPFTPPDAWGWGFRISGDIGILTMSYSPNSTKTKVGDVKLRITSKTSTAFRGYLICTDGNPYPVNGELLQDGRLGMQVSVDCYPTNWTMVRKQNVIEVADRNNTSLVKKPSTLNLLIGDGQGNLGTVDIVTRSVHFIGNMGHAMTDIAFDPVGNLYGITETDLYGIDRNTGISTWKGSLGINDANALVFASDGTLYAAGFADTQLYVVNKNTGQAKAIGNIGPGYRSSGDMAFHGGNLYLSAIGDQLVKIDLANLYNSRAIGNMGFHDVLGLATGDDGVLYGNAGTQIFSIDTVTGAGTLIYDYRGQGLTNANGSTGTPSLESPPLMNKQVENSREIEICDKNALMSALNDPASNKITIFIDGIDFKSFLIDLISFQNIEMLFRGPWPTRKVNYLCKSPLANVLKLKIPSLNGAIIWNGDLEDDVDVEGAVSELQTSILQLSRAGKQIDLITHSFGSVIAYVALARIAEKSYPRPIASFVTLASPLGQEKFWPWIGQLYPSLNIPSSGKILLPNELHIGKWLNAYAKEDIIGGRIGVPGVINISENVPDPNLYSLDHWREAHTAPYSNPTIYKRVIDCLINLDACKGDIVEQTAVQPTMHLTASALGQTAKEGEELKLDVPWYKDLEIEVEFVASSYDIKTLAFPRETTAIPLPADNFDYEWYILGLNVGKGPKLTYKFRAGTTVEVQVVKVNRNFTYMPSITASVKVTIQYRKVQQREDWVCLGRMGALCGNYKNLYILPGDKWIGNESTVEQGCAGNDPNNICIGSMVSVGAIKHDICCGKHNDGYMCSEGSFTADNCLNEWRQAASDWHLRTSFQQLSTLFSWTWKYPPDPSDNPSIGAPGWWVGMVSPLKIIVGYDGDGDDGYKYKPEDAIYCSGQVEKAPVIRPFPRITFGEKSLEIREVYVCTKATAAKDNKVKQAASTTKSKAKKATLAGCQEETSVPTLDSGGAQGALKKFGTGTADRCAQ